MTNFISFYLLIGVAHWASHLLGCDNCMLSIIRAFRFFLEGAINVFGWPIQAIEYLHDFFSKETMKGPTKEDIDQAVKKVTDGILGKMSAAGVPFVELRQNEGETTEEFMTRAKERILAERKKVQENETTNHNGA